jgi:hypothetical protein
VENCRGNGERRGDTYPCVYNVEVCTGFLRLIFSRFLGVSKVKG